MKNLASLFFILSTFLYVIFGAKEVYISPFGKNVPSGGTESNPFESLSYALANLPDEGGIVNVMSGSYTNQGNMLTIYKNVTIAAYPASVGADKVQFDGQGRSQSGFTFKSALNVNFIGIGFKNFAYFGGYGVVSLTSHATNVTLTRCGFWDVDIGVSAQSTGGGVVIHDTSFHNAGTGIAFAYSGFTYDVSIVATDVSFYGKNSGNAVQIAGGNAHFQGNGFHVENLTFGLYVTTQNALFDVFISNAEFINNTNSAIWAYGEPQFSSSRGRISISHSDFIGNGGTYTSGGGVMVGENFNVDLDNTRFVNNKAFPDSAGRRGEGGALYCGSKASINIRNSVIQDNEAYNGGASYCDSDCAFVATDVTLSDNTQKINTNPCPGLN